MVSLALVSHYHAVIIPVLANSKRCQFFLLTFDFLGKLYLSVLTMSFAKYDKYLTTCTTLLARLGAYDAALFGCRYVSQFNDAANAEINTISNQKLSQSSCNSKQPLRTSSRKPITSIGMRSSIRGCPIQAQTNSSLTINLIIHLFPIFYFLLFLSLTKTLQIPKKPKQLTMPSYTTLLTLLTLTTLSLARPQRRPVRPQLNTIATIRLDVDLVAEEARTINITVGTQLDTNL